MTGFGEQLNVKVFVEGGHAFETDGKGHLISWDQEYHDGYTCVLCWASPCRNCDPGWDTEKCSANQTPLPGMELVPEKKSS